MGVYALCPFSSQPHLHNVNLFPGFKVKILLSHKTLGFNQLLRLWNFQNVLKLFFCEEICTNNTQKCLESSLLAVLFNNLILLKTEIASL